MLYFPLLIVTAVTSVRQHLKAETVQLKFIVSRVPVALNSVDYIVIRTWINQREIKQYRILKDNL